CDLPANATCTYSKDQDDLERAHAILFRARRIRDPTDFPEYRRASQKWLFMESEPPPKVWSRLRDPAIESMRYVFNLTSTYSPDSDVPVRERLKCSVDEELYEKYIDTDFTGTKQRPIAWFVSHCQTSSKREDYVRELKRHVPVDVYGGCSDLSCGSQSNSMNSANYECDAMLNSTYKFYLSFENSLCENYVTEKLWRSLIRHINIVPVVLGHENYSELLPNGSFVDAAQFRSPEKLANFLKELDMNDELYNSY
ncbi:hypothetical protein CAPTEDRAFT_36041, partial [Capitella teleta]